MIRAALLSLAVLACVPAVRSAQCDVRSAAMHLAPRTLHRALLFGQQPVFRATVDVVRVDVLATDRGRPIAGLTARDFELLDNGVPQQIELVAAGDLPLDVTFVFDVSSSVSGAVLEHLKSAGSAVIASLKPPDRAALWTFSHRIDAPNPLTHDFERVRGAIDRLEGEGATALLDGLYAALVSRMDSPNRSLVLLFSDGKDNRSWLTEDEVVQAATQSGTVVYAVAFNPPFVIAGGQPLRGTGPDEHALTTIASETGGRLLWAQRDRDLKPRFLEVLQEMRSRYVLTYHHSAAPAAGWHAITVRLTRRSGTVKARTGYFVRPAAQ